MLYLFVNNQLIHQLMPKIEIEILNTSAMSKLKDMEEKNMIRFDVPTKKRKRSSSDLKKYRGAITKEDHHTLDNQLNELRSEWN